MDSRISAVNGKVKLSLSVGACSIWMFRLQCPRASYLPPSFGAQDEYPAFMIAELDD